MALGDIEQALNSRLNSPLFKSALTLYHCYPTQIRHRCLARFRDSLSLRCGLCIQMTGSVEGERSKDIPSAVAVAGGENFLQFGHIHVEKVVPLLGCDFCCLASGRRVADFVAMSVELYRISRKACVDIGSILSQQSHTTLQHLCIPPRPSSIHCVVRLETR